MCGASWFKFKYFHLSVFYCVTTCVNSSNGNDREKSIMVFKNSLESRYLATGLHVIIQRIWRRLHGTHNSTSLPGCSYSYFVFWSPGFKSLSIDRISWLELSMVSFIWRRLMPRKYNSGHDHFPPCPVQMGQSLAYIFSHENQHHILTSSLFNMHFNTAIHQFPRRVFPSDFTASSYHL
jgi:hypothetical protein